jgi:hypothetical protein
MPVFCQAEKLLASASFMDISSENELEYKKKKRHVAPEENQCTLKLKT